MGCSTKTPALFDQHFLCEMLSKAKKASVLKHANNQIVPDIHKTKTFHGSCIQNYTFQIMKCVQAFQKYTNMISNVFC